MCIQKKKKNNTPPPSNPATNFDLFNSKFTMKCHDKTERVFIFYF